MTALALTLEQLVRARALRNRLRIVRQDAEFVVIHCDRGRELARCRTWREVARVVDRASEAPAL